MMRKAGSVVVPYGKAMRDIASQKTAGSVCDLAALNESDTESDDMDVVQTVVIERSESSGDESAPCFEADEGLIFIDWDDTLLPTTELFHRRELPLWDRDVPREVEDELLEWSDAACQLVSQACELGQVVILTNSESPWVEHCIDRFCPKLRAIFDEGAVRIVYGGVSLERQRRVASGQVSADGASSGSSWHCCLDGLAAWWHQVNSEDDDDDEEVVETAEQLTAKKLAGMQQEAKSFDTQDGKGSLRNILSLGDMFYERDAVMQLAASRRSELLSSERLCAKSLLLPRNPRLSQLTATLRACRLLLPAIMESGTNIDIDLDSAEPMPALASVLARPGLVKVPLPGRRDDHVTHDDASSLRQLAEELRRAS